MRRGWRRSSAHRRRSRAASHMARCETSGIPVHPPNGAEKGDRHSPSRRPAVSHSFGFLSPTARKDTRSAFAPLSEAKSAELKAWQLATPFGSVSRSSSVTTCFLSLALVFAEYAGNRAYLAGASSVIPAISGSMRIRPQYSQTRIFFLILISSWRWGGMRLKQPPQALRWM